MKTKKLKVPKSVLKLKMSPKKFAQKHNIRIKGKHMSKKEKKHNLKRLKKEYAEFAASGLNKAVKILAEHPEKTRKTEKVTQGVDNILTNIEVMEQISKLYKKSPDQYPNMLYLPYMIMNTLVYYSSEKISDQEKEDGKNLDSEKLIEFCEKILKKEIKRYKKLGLNDAVAYQMATVIPTTKLLKTNRKWYKRLIQEMFDLAEKESIEVDLILKAIVKIDKKKKVITKKEFLEDFFSAFILQKSTNKQAKFTDTQKELYDALVERALVYMNGLKPKKLREMLKDYIKCRKGAEEIKKDGNRVIKFIDHAHSNSPYTNIKQVVSDLIEDNSTNEYYLS